MNKTWAILGGGNGGTAAAAHLGIKGENVRLYDISPETVNTINEQGGIYAEGAVEGFGKLEFASLDIGKAVRGADIVMVVAPAFAHKDIAVKAAPYLKRGQIVILHPATMFGSVVFLNTLRNNGNNEDITICETMTLLYAARLKKAGTVQILGLKKSLPIASLPSDRINDVADLLAPVFPEMTDTFVNILESGLSNLNCVMHPLPTLLCTSLIESDHDWLYYYDGISPSVGKAASAVDKERIEIGKELGLDLISIEDFYERLYGATGKDLSEITNQVEAYAGVKGHASMNTRYLLEDIPYAIVPMTELAEICGVKTPLMDATIAVAGAVLDKDLRSEGLTLKDLGLSRVSKNELLEFITTGNNIAGERAV